MTDQETTLIVQDILIKALEGPALSFKPIVSWQEFRYYQKYKVSTKIIIKVLRQSATSLFMDYCRTVITGISDITKLFAYQQILDAATFYKTELETVQKMLDDYDAYLGKWRNLFNALLGEVRDL